MYHVKDGQGLPVTSGPSSAVPANTYPLDNIVRDRIFGHWLITVCGAEQNNVKITLHICNGATIEQGQLSSQLSPCSCFIIKYQQSLARYIIHNEYLYRSFNAAKHLNVIHGSCKTEFDTMGILGQVIKSLEMEGFTKGCKCRD